MKEMEAVFEWELTESGGVRILCGYGASPYVTVPEQIKGMPVQEIGAYCFSDVRKEKNDSKVQNVSEDGLQEKKQGAEDGQPWMRELSGNYIQKVILPDSIEKLGNLAFYNCTGLKELQFGVALSEVGSDAFMNCLHLETLVVHGSVGTKSGLKQILSQRTADTQVLFRVGEEIQAALFYPEYYEVYDEVGPAHIFALNLTGEGFRARQCFQNAVVDFEKYDAIFEQASVEESVRTLCKMAVNRLRYPVFLGGTAKQRYTDYIRGQQEWLVAELVKKKELELLLFLYREGYLECTLIGKGAQQAAGEGWTEGAASLLRLRQTMQKKIGRTAERSDRYVFREF